MLERVSNALKGNGATAHGTDVRAIARTGEVLVAFLAFFGASVDW